MAKIKTSDVILLVVALVVIAVVLPIGIGLISAMGETTVTINNVTKTLAEIVDPTVLTLLTVLLPILSVVGIIMYFIPRGKD